MKMNNQIEQNMPKIVFVNGWRLFFYSNELDEPMHIHAQKAEVECKFWLYPDKFEIREEFAFNIKTNQRREVRKVIFDHFDELVKAWEEIHERH